MAPEVMKEVDGKCRYNGKADVFSFGMVLYEMLFRRHPFHDSIHNRTCPFGTQHLRKYLTSSYFSVCYGYKDSGNGEESPSAQRQMLSGTQEAAQTMLEGRSTEEVVIRTSIRTSAKFGGTRMKTVIL